MSKKNDNNKTDKSNEVDKSNEAEPMLPEPTPPEAPAPASTPTEPAPAEASEVTRTHLPLAPAEIVVHGVPEYPAILDTQMEFDPYGPHARDILIKRFPHAAQYLKRYVAVTPEQVMEAIETLPDPLRTNMLAAFERMNPDRVGQHAAREVSMRFFEMRLNQGGGNDEQRPATTPQGGYYSRDERVHSGGNEAMAKALNIPLGLDVYIIGFSEGRTLWPPKSDEDEGPRIPLCSSKDRKKGSAYGVCEACTYKPVYVKDAPRPEMQCMNEVVFYVVPVDFSGIYSMRFSKSAMETARTIVKKLNSGGWSSAWSRQIRFTSKQEVSTTDKNIRWFEPVAAVLDGQTPKELSSVLRVFAQMVDTLDYWPAMRRIYNLADNPKAPAETNSNTTDGSALAASLGVPSGGALKAPALPNLAGKINV